MKRVSLFLLFFLLAVAHAQVSVTDDLGREVRLERPPARIVSMVPTHTEMVCALGACDLLVGVDSFSDYPPTVAGLPQLGSGLTGMDNAPDLEAIVALAPDLVLVSEYGDLAEQLARLGLVVYAGSPQTLQDIYEQADTLGILLGREAEAAALVRDLQAELDGVAALVAGVSSPTVFVELDPTPFSVGPGSFVGDLLGRAGGDNIVTAALGDFPQLDPEYVVAADPEVIILLDAPYGESAATVAARPGWGGLRAVTGGRVIELSEAEAALLGRAGPRVGEAVRLLATLLHPDLLD